MMIRQLLAVVIAAFAILALLTTPLDSDTVPIFVWVSLVAAALIWLVLTVGRSRRS